MPNDFKLPPHNLEAERSILGAILLDTEALIKIGDTLQPTDFYNQTNRILFETMLDLFAKHMPIDVLTLGNRLEEKHLIKQTGGRSGLIEIANSVTTASNITHYAQIISKKAALRRLIQAASTITELGYDENQELDLTLDTAEQTLFNVSTNFIKQSFIPLKNILTSAFDRIDELHKHRGTLRGLSSGYTGLDNLLGGLQRSDLIILAARPSVGKTALALDIIRNVAIRTRQPVGFFSLEMSKEQLVDRMICAEANLDLWKLRTGRLSDTENDYPKIGDALGRLSEAPIFIDDSPIASIMTIRTKARRLQSEHGLSMIVVDYLQLMEARNSSNSDNRVQEVAEISRGLKQIARELNIPVLALAQLSRAVELTKPAIPRLSHLRDSGSIEQDADVVMFLYRKAADRNYQQEELTPEEKTLAEVHIAKHRNGPTGMVKLFWDSTRASFKNLETRNVTQPMNSPGSINNASTGSNQKLAPGLPPKGYVPTNLVALPQSKSIS